MRNDLARLNYLSNGCIEVALHTRCIWRTQIDQIYDITDKQSDIVERIIELMRHAGRQLT